jgi:hypothetical protein
VAQTFACCVGRRTPKNNIKSGGQECPSRIKASSSKQLQLQ